jgi:uncharacterized protein YjbI with pentapeptide repeats
VRAKSPAAQAACPVPAGKTISGDQTNVNFAAWPAGSLVGANFKGATLKGAIFTGQDLTGASFDSANLGPSDKGPVDFTNTTLNKTCFINANMDATDFTFAAITCADFSYTSLMKAKFGPQQNIQPGNGCRTKFIGSTLDVHAISTSNWGRVDFSDAIFTNLSPNVFSLNGIDITGAMLGCTTFTAPPAPGCKAFSNIDMTGANLTGVDLTGAVLVKAKLDHAALNGVRLPHASLNDASLTCAQFYGSTPNSNCKQTPPVSSNPNSAANLTQAVLQYADLSNATLDFAVLTGANLSGATFQNASFQNATLEATETIPAASVLGADFTNANFANAHLDQVLFNNAILTNAHFEQGITLNGTDFSGSIMPGANFTGAVLEGVNFSSTILENANFTGTTMKITPGGLSSGVNFTCAQLGGADFTNATITAATFTAAVMPPGPSTITPPQSCCAQKGGGLWCGTVDITQQAFGSVTYPVPADSITCPNGDVAVCSGAQWILPQWQTNLCNANHTTQTVWSPPDCGGTPGQYVVFKDLNLKQCILATLPGNPTEVTLETAAAMLAVNCPGRSIADLTGLEKFTNLTSLDVTANQVKQFALRLPQLQSLKISDNQLTSLDVSNLNPNGPVRLEAANNQLKSVVGLASVNLVVLDLSHNLLTSFDLPEQYQSLTYADLSYNNLTNVLDQYNTDLSKMTLLNYLDLSGNSIPGIGSVASIANPPSPAQPTLLSLFLACNPTFQCEALNLPGGANPPQALMRSECADYNAQSGQWIVLTNPQCPVSRRAMRGRPADVARPRR